VRSLIPCALLVAFALSCGSDDQAAEPTSAVAGRIFVGSCPPAGPGSPPCETERAGGVRLVVYDTGGNEVASAESDDEGAFRIPLEPGAYMLVPKDAPPPALNIEKPIEFRVRPDSTTRLRVVLDTGVR
jgi:hypothetical protein